jgi:hypothetical protein
MWSIWAMAKPLRPLEHTTRSLLHAAIMYNIKKLLNYCSKQTWRMDLTLYPRLCYFL